MNTKLLRLPSLRINLLPILQVALFLPWMVPVVSGQTNTTVNLGTQSRNPDFSAQPVTRPVTVGTSLPTTCTVGQLFFNSSAPAGSNLFSCPAANAWSQVASNLATPLAIASGGSGTSNPSLVAGANVTIAGTWPNQTINSTGGGTGGSATAIQGTAVASTAPANNQTLIYSTSAASYVPTSVFTLQNGLGTAAAGSTNLQVNVSMAVRAVNTTSDSLVNTDCGGLVTYNNSAAVSVALPQPGTGGNFTVGCPITVRNYGAGQLTITPSSSTIGGAATQAVAQNKACLIVSDGSNWQLGNCN